MLEEEKKSFYLLLIYKIKMAGASLNSNKPSTTETIKFMCSYGGRILPRYPDGKLRYYGGHTRVVAVNRSISYSELMVKLGELCGKTVSLRCQLPTEDLDALVCIKSDEDLANLVEEYDRAACMQPTPIKIKIRAFLSTPKKCSPSTTPMTPTTPATSVSTGGAGSGSGSRSGSSSSTSTQAASPKYPSLTASYSTKHPVAITNPCIYASPVKLPFCYNKSARKLPCLGYQNSNRFCVVSNGNHWQ